MEYIRDISVDDDYLEGIVTEFNNIDFYWHTADAPGKGIAYAETTLIPPNSMPEFIAVIEKTSELSDLKSLLQSAFRDNKWGIRMMSSRATAGTTTCCFFTGYSTL